MPSSPTTPAPCPTAAAALPSTCRTTTPYVDPDYNAGELSFAADTQWDEFLLWWTGVPLASWTYMIYMGADTNLEPDAITDFLEMASVGSTDAVNIVVQLDRAAAFDTSFDDWADTRRGLVSFGDVPDSAWGASIGEADMGDPDTLSDFVNWGITITRPSTMP